MFLESRLNCNAESNPFSKGSRFWYAFKLLPNKISNMIDYGCYDGSFLSGLGKVSFNLFGVDRNAKQINSNKIRFPCISFSLIDGAKIDAPDEYFDVVTCLEVLEHVPSESELAKELFRVMKPNSVLVISVPHCGIFEFLDTGNIKFDFPLLVKFYYLYLKRDRITYEQRFLNNQDGMIGDFSLSNAMRHKHYRIEDLMSILSPYFVIEEVVYYGLFTPIIDILKIIFCLIGRCEFLRHIFERLDNFDKQFSYGLMSYNIILKCKRSSIHLDPK